MMNCDSFVVQCFSLLFAGGLSNFEIAVIHYFFQRFDCHCNPVSELAMAIDFEIVAG